ncbi:MAG: arginine--tRNA ligase [Holosporales bacterium]|nr:arginine--tRNA ligase [Holosporales bacterium]
MSEVASSDLFSAFSTFIQQAIERVAQRLQKPVPPPDAVALEVPKEAAFGDLSTNAAMVLAKQWKRPPKDIATALQQELSVNTAIASLEVAGAGFLNITVTQAFFLSCLKQALIQKDHYGRSLIGQGQKVNVEYVSANPTGPLHAGHLRGAVTGDVLASLLAFSGFEVTREYYVNDAGHQVDVLVDSLYYHYATLCHKALPEPPEFYPGAYLVASAQRFREQEVERWREDPNWRAPVTAFALADMLRLIKEDMAALGVQHDLFSSERALVSSGRIEAAIAFLKNKGLIYEGILPPPKGQVPTEVWESHPQMLFRATQFGDDQDRPLKKADGSWTYFATDIAYHWDKIQRGFTTLIDFWGADHGGYVKRMEAAVSALSSEAPVSFDVRLCQIVRFMQDGQEVRMSKRAGTFIEAKEVIDRVGKDAVRFFLLTRRDDAPLDFDFEKVVEETRDNPVFYVQYAYARTGSVLRQNQSIFPRFTLEDLLDAPFSREFSLHERALVKILLSWPRQVALATRGREPHRLAFYLLDLAAAFHALWTAGKDNATLRFVHSKDLQKTKENMLFVHAVRNVLSLGLRLMGVTPAEELH